MTKKDFELIARVVRSITDEDTRHKTTDAFVNELSLINNRFAELQFRLACGDAPAVVQRAVRKIAS